MRTVVYWFIDNPIASNLLMMVFLVSGTLAYLNTRQEEFPSIETGTIQVNVPYPGAAPEEVEQAVCLHLEEALENVENIQRMTSTAREGGCAATLQLEGGADLNRVLNDVKSTIDGIVTFPDDIEEPTVASFSPVSTVMSLALVADTDDASLKEIGEQIRLELIDLDGISRVEVNYIRPYEISVECHQQICDGHARWHPANSRRRDSAAQQGPHLRRRRIREHRGAFFPGWFAAAAGRYRHGARWLRRGLSDGARQRQECGHHRNLSNR